MIPVVIAAVVFGRNWGGHVVEFSVDNAAVVAVLNATFSSNLHLMHLTRLLVFFAEKFNFWFVSSHIPGSKNVAADALSMNYLSVFSTQVPQADHHPTQVPLLLVSLLSQDNTWTCTSWIEQFSSILQQV